jgi:hypothetical protein
MMENILKCDDGKNNLTAKMTFFSSIGADEIKRCSHTITGASCDVSWSVMVISTAFEP